MKWNLRRGGLLVLLLSSALSGCVVPMQGPGAPDPAMPSGSQPSGSQWSADQLQQLVAPIALYPDSLVAQVLAASAFPDQVADADRWLQSNGGLQGLALAQAADQQAWDGSVKALTAFPDVLGNMDRNLSWTSSLGDAYYNEPQAVMDAIQAMRQRAQAAGTLQSTPQQQVYAQGSEIDIEPANPDVVYVPAYDPWAVYGMPLEPWPDWYAYPGIWYDGVYPFFGAGFAVGVFGGFGWGWHHWGADWPHHHVNFNHAPYAAHSPTFYDRGRYYHGPMARPGIGPALSSPPRMAPRPFGGSVPAARGYVPAGREQGVRSGIFSGYGHGGDARGFASRGGASLGGAHGGGTSRGGGRR